MANLTRTLADNSALRQLGLVLIAVLVGVGGGLAVVAGNPIIPFALLAAIVPLPWLLTRPMAGVLLVLAIAILLPFGTLPFNVGVTPAFIELGLLLVLAVVGLDQLRQPERGPIRTPLDLPIVLFLGAIGFAFVLGLSRDANSTILHNFFKLALALTFFFTASQVLRSLPDLRFVVRALVLLGGLSTLLGLALWAIPDAIAERLLRALRVVGYPTDRVLRFVEDDPSKGQRATGTSVDPNSFGGLILLIFAFTLAQFIGKRPLLPRPLLGFFLAVEGVTLVETSRGAFLAAVAVAAFLGLLRYRRLVIIGGVVGAVALVAGLGSGYLARILSGLRFEDQAQLMRLAEFRNALDIIGRYPAFGVGFGTAGELDLTTGVSSIYLTLAERTGLFGLVSYLICMGVFFVLLLPWLLGQENSDQGSGIRGRRSGAQSSSPSPQRSSGADSLDNYGRITATPARPTPNPSPQGGELLLLTGVGPAAPTPVNRRGKEYAAKLSAPSPQQGEGRGEGPIASTKAPAPANTTPVTRHSSLVTRYELDSILLGAASAVLGALIVGVGDHYFFNIEYPHMVALMWLALALGLAAPRLLIMGQPEQEEA